MNCQLCKQAIATYWDWLMGNCPKDPVFGHKLTGAEVEVLRLRRSAEKEEEVAP